MWIEYYKQRFRKNVEGELYYIPSSQEEIEEEIKYLEEVMKEPYERELQKGRKKRLKFLHKIK